MSKFISYIRMGGLIILLLGVGICFASPEVVTFKSAIVWRADDKGDYQFNEQTFSSAGSYEIEKAYISDGNIKTLTAGWEFEGEVRLKISVDNGSYYIPAVNGAPVIIPDYIKGNKIKWKAEIAEDSKLEEVKISYSDSLNVIASFGQPALSGFKFRKLLFINNPNNKDSFNAQVQIKVAQDYINQESEEDSQETVAECHGKIRTDFKDIRFTSADAETVIPYYLEKIEGEAPSRIAAFWIKIPQIPAGGVNIYVYYDNSDAEDFSNPEEVFDFWDDFTGQEINSEKWEIYLGGNGECSISDSQLKLKSARIMSKEYQIKDGLIEVLTKPGTNPEVQIITRRDDENSQSAQIAYSSGFQGTEHCIAIGNIVKINQPQPISAGSSYYYQVKAKDEEIEFIRKDLEFQEGESKEVTVSCVDEGGLTVGNIGLECSAGGVTYYDWIRVRKLFEQEPFVEQAGSEEVPDSAVFDEVGLSENGNLILSPESIAGSYVSKKIVSPFKPRVIIPSWSMASFDSSSDVESEKSGIKVDVSANGGITYKLNCENGKHYYVSKEDFIPGENLIYRIRFNLTESSGSKSSFEEFSLDYRPGKILLIKPNGGEEWEVGTEEKILWSALNYETTYEMKLEYSTDNGKTYNTIAERAPNIGAFSWKIPQDILSSDKARVKVSDACCDDIYVMSNDVFKLIGLDGVEVHEEEEALIEEAIDLGKFIEAGKRPGTTLYDVLIKLGDNHSLDSEEDARACYKHGDIVVVRPAGHLWGAEERKRFLIIQVYLTGTEVQEITRPKKIATGKLDEQGRPIMKIIKRRAKRINLDKLGLSGKGLKTMRSLLEDKTLAPEVIEEK